MQNAVKGAAVLALLAAASFASGGKALLAAKAEFSDTTAVESIEGRWINPGRSVIIVIGRCGDYACGTVEWASDKAQDDARKGTDQLVGAQILSDVRAVSGERWEGKLFIPDMNRRVHAKIELLGCGDALKVSGCAVGKSLCRSQTWTRQTVSD